MRRLSSLTFESIVAGIVGQLLLVITGVLSARLLGPEGRGELAVLMVVPTAISVIGECGVVQAIIFFSGKFPLLTGKIFKVAISALIIQSIVLSIGYYTWLNLHQSLSLPQVANDNKWISIAVIPLTLTSSYLMGLYQAVALHRGITLLRVVPLGLFAVFLLTTASLSQEAMDPAVFVWSWILSGILTCIIFGGVLIKVISATEFNENTERLSIRHFLSYALRGHFATLSLIDGLQLDKLIIGFMLSPTALGLYVVAQSFSNLPKILVSSLTIVIFPAMTRESRMTNRVDLLLGFLSRSTWYFGGFALILLFLQPYLIPAFFGIEYKDSIEVSQILILAASFGAIRKLISDGMRSLGKPGIASMTELLSAMVFSLLCFLLIAKYLLPGVAIALLIAQLVTYATLRAALNRHLVRG